MRAENVEPSSALPCCHVAAASKTATEPVAERGAAAAAAAATHSATRESFRGGLGTYCSFTSPGCAWRW
ncbi:hypothetical protein CLOP_g1302 [Closterium sp. NIES-67]|nr:hypothetical protein CLOP_g1302 [Closterium sp. NIES-67]